MFRTRLKKRSFLLLFGTIFLGIGAPLLLLGLILACFVGPFAAIPCLVGAIFATIGYLFRRHELAKVNAILSVLEHGALAEGQVSHVTRDPTDAPAGVAAYSVVYVFFLGGAGRYGGVMNSHDGVHATHQPGEPLWVVYNPQDPNQNSLWPPIA